MRGCRFLIQLGLIVLGGCSGKEGAVDNGIDRRIIQPMLGAVMNGGPNEVRALAENHIGLNERDPANQSTPLITAASTDQWLVVEILIDYGADIWAHDEFGITAAQMAATSRIVPKSTGDEARLRVIEKLKARGYPYPPPDPETVLALDKAGKWPPAGVRR